ncbi:MAG: hypothetical protein JOZ96_29070 [Acidobacteria bacterium]|nr:hypothetical protein [Acidobacteriota bacterium]
MSDAQYAYEQGLQAGGGQGLAAPSPRIVDAMNKWSGSFFKLTLPSGLGTKATIKSIEDEGAKVLSMGMYLGHRSANVTAVPYDGARYEGHTMKDESEGTLWMYNTDLPDGFAPAAGERFFVSLGKTHKCHQCRGQGRVRCSSCGGRVRWTERRGDNIIEKVCSCGDGKQNCGSCAGFGEMLQGLDVSTKYFFDERKDKEYSGRLPENLLMGSAGNLIFQHTADFERRVIAEAIDGFEPEEFDRLMRDTHHQLKSAATSSVGDKMVNPQILHGLIDGYFRGIPNPVAANKRLAEEILPVRMKCEVTDVPVQAVKYEYKGKDYSLYVYGNSGAVWTEGEKPSEFTWKLGVLLGVIGAILLLILIAALVK